jgi:hypothetical protein
MSAVDGGRVCDAFRHGETTVRGVVNAGRLWSCDLGKRAERFGW